MRGVVGGLIVVVLACAGCGADDRGAGTISFHERWLHEPGFVEGYEAFASIEDADGHVIARGNSAQLEPEPFLERRLDPGRYRVEGYVRSCAAACGPGGGYDAPSHRCAATVELDGDTAVTFVRDHPDECHVEIDQPPGSGSAKP